ncbi:MAG: YidC/Oxa1 family insertase periplasmic-domain containing protein, partial [Chitinophagales bacterium]
MQKNNKNTLIGVLLISLIIMLYIYNRASNTPVETNEDENLTEEIADTVEESTEVAEVISNPIIINDSTELIHVVDSIVSTQEIKAKDVYGDFYQGAFGKEETYTLENDLLSVEISSKGAQITQVELKEYKTFYQEDLLLVDSSQSLNFELNTLDGKFIPTKDMYFDVEQFDAQS